MNQKADNTTTADTQPGARLRQRRRELGMTQRELAKVANLSPAAISQFESGVRMPAGKTLRNLSDALKTTVDWLLGRAPRNYDDILADPDIGPIFQGIMALPKRDKQSLATFYHSLKNSAEAATDDE